ncbi:MAG: hypothetical protein ACK5IC_00905 [Moheibacter sp.]
MSYTNIIKTNYPEDEKVIYPIIENESWIKNKFGEAGLASITTKSNVLITSESKSVYKTYQGKNYTFEEWTSFEEEQFKIYQENRNRKGFWNDLFG